MTIQIKAITLYFCDMLFISTAQGTSKSAYKLAYGPYGQAPLAVRAQAA